MSKQNKASKLKIAFIRRVGVRLIAVALLFVAVFISSSAHSDEFDSVLHSSQSNDSVNIIATPGWQSVFDNDPGAPRCGAEIPGRAKHGKYKTVQITSITSYFDRWKWNYEDLVGFSGKGCSS